MITVVDLGISNISSVLKALSCIDAPYILSADPRDILEAEKILLPGVGSFGAGMKSIMEKKLFSPLREAALDRKIPFLGICLGMQLMASKGYEAGEHAGLSIIEGEVCPMDKNIFHVVPHMGWNNLESVTGNILLQGLSINPHFYFVHGYHLTKYSPETAVNYCVYNSHSIVAGVAKGNIFGMQFHPEKSQNNGLQVLRNFKNYA